MDLYLAIYSIEKLKCNIVVVYDVKCGEKPYLGSRRQVQTNTVAVWGLT